MFQSLSKFTHGTKDAKKYIKFQERWLSLADLNETIVSKWVQKHSSDPNSCILYIPKKEQLTFLTEIKQFKNK